MVTCIYVEIYTCMYTEICVHLYKATFKSAEHLGAPAQYIFIKAVKNFCGGKYVKQAVPEVCMCRRHVGVAKYAHQRHHGRVPGRAARGHLVRAENESLQQRRLREPEHSVCNAGLRRQWVRDTPEVTVSLNCSALLSVSVWKTHRLSCSLACAGTIPPIKSPLEKNDDVKKLFSIGSPVILVTVGVALLFIIRKKRKEKRLKRLRGEERTWAVGVCRKYTADTIRVLLCSDTKVKCVFHLNMASWNLLLWKIYLFAW